MDAIRQLDAVTVEAIQFLEARGMVIYRDFTADSAVEVAGRITFFRGFGVWREE